MARIGIVSALLLWIGALSPLGIDAARAEEPASPPLLERSFVPCAETTGWQAMPDPSSSRPPCFETYRDWVRSSRGRGPIGWIRGEMARGCLCRKRLAEVPRDFWYQDYFRPRTAGGWASLTASAAIVAGGIALFVDGDEDLIHDVSDAGQVILPALGFGVPILHADAWGLGQYALQNGISSGMTEGIKHGVERWRPDLEAADSYPSGHTTAAFSGASFLHTRYGPNWGVPAYLGALLVGATRVNLERHFLDDVIAGAGVSMVSNWLLAIPFGGECRELTRFGRPARWRLEFTFSVVEQSQNDVQAPSDTGDRIDLNDWNAEDEGYPTSRFSVQYNLNPRHELMLRVDPFEIQGARVLTESLSFGGASFAAGEDTYSRWMAHEYKFRWRYRLLPCHRRFDLRAGVTGVIADYRVEIYSATDSGSVGKSGVMAVPHLYAAWEFARNFELSVAAEGIPGVDFAAMDVETVLRWHWRPRWDFGVGYRWNKTRVSVDAIDNEVEGDELFLAFGRSF